VALDNLLAKRQPKPRSRIFRATMQSLQELKDMLGMCRVKPNAIVTHRKDPLSLLTGGRHVHLWRLCAAEFDGVLNQVLHQLHELRRICHDHWQRIVGHHGTALSNRPLQIGQG